MGTDHSFDGLDKGEQAPKPKSVGNQHATPGTAVAAPVSKLVICAGLPRSGSTWVYNAVLKLLRLHTKAAGLFSNEIPTDLRRYSESDECIVVKCHAPDANLIALARLMDAPVILTVRDPRDCLVSFEAAFRSEKASALHQLSESASAILQFGEYQRQLLLKYEEVSDRVKVLESLSAILGIPAKPGQLRKLSEEFSPDAVKENIARWEAEGSLDAERPSEVWTEESHWHANHIANGLTGKYVDHISPRQAAIVGGRLKNFFQKFGYIPDAPPPIRSGDVLEFGDDGIAYAVEGFSYPEEWGAWTDGSIARIILPLEKKARRIQLEIALIRGCLGSEGGATAQMRINKRKVADLFYGQFLPDELLFVYSGGASSDLLELEFRFQGLASPRSLNLGDDDRLLGVGIRSVRISYQ